MSFLTKVLVRQTALLLAIASATGGGGVIFPLLDIRLDSLPDENKERWE